jgi:hypothetical protein
MRILCRYTTVVFNGCVIIYVSLLMGSLLHDSLVSRVLWTSRAVVVAGVRAW